MQTCTLKKAREYVEVQGLAEVVLYGSDLGPTWVSYRGGGFEAKHAKWSTSV